VFPPLLLVYSVTAGSKICPPDDAVRLMLVNSDKAGKPSMALLLTSTLAFTSLVTKTASISLAAPSKNQCVLPSNLPANVTFPPLIARMIVE